MLTDTQQQKLDKFVDCIYELLQDQLYGLMNHKGRQITKNRAIFARMLGQMLYDAPQIHTGKVSVRLIEQKLNDHTTKPSAEHHLGRHKGGEALLRLVDRSLYMNIPLDREEVRQIVVQHCHVHYTTSEENAALRRHQKQCSSEAAYRRANVVLVDAGELFHTGGRKSAKWKEQMRARYQPVVDDYYNPKFVDTSFTLTLPSIIN